MALTELRLGPARVLWTGRAELHLGHNPPRAPHDETCCGSDVQARRAKIQQSAWHYLTQVHGSDAVVVDAHAPPGVAADAAVTSDKDVTLMIATADCAPVAFASNEGVVGAAHAGWPGLQLGVLGNTVEQMRRLGATGIVAALGPCIHRECYEFGKTGLQDFAKKWGDHVVSSTSNGKPAFDLPAAVATELTRNGVDLRHVDARCTACSGEHFSYRRTKTTDRQVMLVCR